MNEYVIFSDSSTDMPHSLAEELGISIVPLSFRIDEKDYQNLLDGSTLGFKDFYNLLRAGKMSTTTQVTLHVYQEWFAKPLKEGKDILYLAFTSGLSGSYQQSVVAAEELRAQFPNRKIIIVDTLCASMGQGLIVYLATQEARRGKTMEEVAKFVEDIKLNICHWVVAEDLNHLKRGGRVSATTAFVGTMLNIKPIIHVNEEGKLIPVGKARGRRKSIETLVEQMKKTAINPEEQTVFISHSDCYDDALILADLVKESMHVKDIVISYIGPVIGSHTGPGTLALFFVGTKR